MNFLIGLRERGANCASPVQLGRAIIGSGGGGLIFLPKTRAPRRAIDKQGGGGGGVAAPIQDDYEPVSLRGGARTRHFD